MKKWMFLYIVAGIALLTAGTMSRLSDVGSQAEILAGPPESSASGCAVNEPDTAYLLVQSEGDGSWDAVAVGRGRKNCRILGTVVMDMTYYLYCYRDDQEDWYYSVDRYDPAGGTVWEDVSVRVRTEKELPLAFGGADGQLFCVTTEKDGQSVREYALTVADPASGWQELREIPAPGEYQIRLAAYEADSLSLCAEDGTVYHYQNGDVTVQKGLDGTVFAENRNVMDEAAIKAWKNASMRKAAGKILLPGLLLFSFFGILLFGLLYRGSPVRRMFCLSVGVLAAAVLAAGVLSAGQIQDRSLAVLFLIGLSVLGVAFLLLGTAWNRFVAELMSLAREKFDYQLPDKAPIGMQRLWKSLEEISRSMGEMRYEKHQNFKSYYRFTPGKMEKLLGKQDLSEVEVGDSVQVKGLLAQLSLQSRNESDGEHYQKFVTRGFEIMSRILEEKKGILVSQDADFDRFKLLFLERPEEAVRFGIDTVHAYGQDALLQSAEKLILIHASCFLYGVSGTKERAIPFLYAKEEELLDSYIEPLRRAGVRLVLTENVLEKLSDGFAFRYIGFVKDAGGERSMKLYECLDACEERQRYLRSATADSFDRALHLFYSNDFYLARNTFNEVLKSNPEDQITRWYLFNCEYHLNTAGDTEVAYGLFENRMLEQQYQTM